MSPVLYSMSLAVGSTRSRPITACRPNVGQITAWTTLAARTWHSIATSSVSITCNCHTRDQADKEPDVRGNAGQQFLKAADVRLVDERDGLG